MGDVKVKINFIFRLFTMSLREIDLTYIKQLKCYVIYLGQNSNFIKLKALKYLHNKKNDHCKIKIVWKISLKDIFLFATHKPGKCFSLPLYLLSIQNRIRSLYIPGKSGMKCMVTY